jgi:hypothetical protein
MSNTLKSLNKFIVTFFQANNIEADNDWMNASNQSSLKTLLTKALKSSCPTKDPNAPKRGKSAYLFFCTTMRDKVKESLSEDSKATDVTRELGVRWNLLKDDNSRTKEMEKYKKQAEDDKSRYDSERANYVPDETVINQGRIKKVNTGPKRAKSAYLYFCLDKRQEVKEELGEGSSATDITRELGARWNVVKANGSTKKYDDEAEEDKTRYYNEKESGIVPVVDKEVITSVVVPTTKASSKKEAPPKKEKVVSKKKEVAKKEVSKKEVSKKETSTKKK